MMMSHTIKDFWLFSLCFLVLLFSLAYCQYVPPAVLTQTVGFPSGNGNSAIFPIQTAEIVDINGDGLPDYVLAVYITGNTDEREVWMNNGCTWVANWDGTYCSQVSAVIFSNRDILDIFQAAAFLQVRVEDIELLKKVPGFPGLDIYPGGPWRISKQQLLQWLENVNKQE